MVLHSSGVFEPIDEQIAKAWDSKQDMLVRRASCASDTAHLLTHVVDPHGTFPGASRKLQRLENTRGRGRERRIVGVPLVAAFVSFGLVKSDLFSAPGRHPPRLVCGSQDRGRYPRASAYLNGRPVRLFLARAQR